jgi:hypothetical protein
MPPIKGISHRSGAESIAVLEEAQHGSAKTYVGRILPETMTVNQIVVGG